MNPALANGHADTRGRSARASSGTVEGAARLGAQLTKVPRALAIGKHLIPRGGLRMVEALPLIIGEEKQLVLYDGAADSGAKHVPAQLWLFADAVGLLHQRVRVRGSDGQAVLPGVRIQDVVAEELEGRAVKSV